MQQTTGVTVLATQLSSTDRRALSQAWYSALHLAQHAARSGSPRAAAADTARAVRVPAAGRRASAGSPATSPVGARGSASHARDGARGVEAGGERRAPKSELARAIERGVARRAVRTGTTAFAVSVAGGRVCVLVRGDGDAARMIAVCAPPLRERVARALAAARFALAGRAIRAEVVS